MGGAISLCASEVDRARSCLARDDVHGARMAFAVASCVLKTADWQDEDVNLDWQTLDYRRTHSCLRMHTGAGLYAVYLLLGE